MRLPRHGSAGVGTGGGGEGQIAVVNGFVGGSSTTANPVPSATSPARPTHSRQLTFPNRGINRASRISAMQTRANSQTETLAGTDAAEDKYAIPGPWVCVPPLFPPPRDMTAARGETIDGLYLDSGASPTSPQPPRSPSITPREPAMDKAKQQQPTSCRQPSILAHG